jgi:hypothetical protein
MGDINVELGRTRTAYQIQQKMVVTLLLMQGVQINHQQQIQLQLVNGIVIIIQV